MSDKFELISKYLVSKLQNDKDTYILVSDVWECYFFEKYKENLEPETKSRLINVGISEANAIGLSAGLAQSGKNVIVLGLASFLTGRAFEQIKLDVCYNNCNVKIIGIHGGVIGPKIAGYSHWAIEDIALMNALPNIEIVDIAPTDCEFYKLMDESFKRKAPTYIRIDCPYEPHINLDYNVEYGEISKVVAGEDIAIISTGRMLIEALNIRNLLAKDSLLPSIYSCHTLKPFDTKTIEKIIETNQAVVVLEEHVKGGLSSFVADTIAKGNKKIKFYPMHITNEQYNFVALTIETVFNQLYDFESLYNDLMHIKSKKEYIFKKKYSNQDGLTTIELKVLNLPLLKLKERKKNKKGKLKYRVYAFDKMRII